MIKLSEVSVFVVCPLANEIATAEQFTREVIDLCRRYNFKKFVFCAIFDRTCHDGTLDLMRSIAGQLPELRVVYAVENKTVVDAYMRGYHEAIGEGVDWILEIDAGFSHQPCDIPRFIESMRTGRFDCVFGSRFCRGGKMVGLNLRRYVVSRGGSFLSNLILGTHLHDMTSGFELFSREALTYILDKGIFSRGPFFQTEIRAHAHSLRITEVPITYVVDTSQPRSGSVRDALKNLMLLRGRCQSESWQSARKGGGADV